MKIALKIAYDGTDFRGWARQRGQRTVQGVLEERLAHLLKRETSTIAAGRTDAGVHAAGQVVSLEAPVGTDPAWLADRLNRWLAPEVAVRDAVAVGRAFDARHSARRRVYDYALYSGTSPDPFIDRFALFVRAALDVRAMRAASRALVGEHDFAAFCRRGQLGTRRRVRSVAFRSDAARLVMRITADSFCHQMVRALTGTLLEIGTGRRPAGDLAEILEGRERSAAGPVAPPRGLTLVAVGYSRDPFRRR